jgi:hypothetical protein
LVNQIVGLHKLSLPHHQNIPTMIAGIVKC